MIRQTVRDERTLNGLKKRMNNDVCVCVKVQLVQVTMVSRARGTCPDLCLSSFGFPASQYLLRLGKDGRQPEKRRMTNMKGLKKSGKIIKILSSLSPAGHKWSYCLWLPTHPTPKPRLTCWNLKESPHHLPEEICSSVAHEICPALSLISFFKLRRPGLHN